jgi:hypothetical protein
LRSFYILVLFLSFSNFLIAGTESEDMCKCLSKAYASKKKSDSKACLVLQEKHAKKLKDGSEHHNLYKAEVLECEKKITSADSENPANNSKTYDEKVKEVCECFDTTSKQGKRPMPCFKLQDDYSKTVGDKKTDFIKETNLCAK